MSRTVVFKHSVTIGLLTVAQAVLPPLLAGACLYALVWLLGAPASDQDYLLLTALVIVLGAVLLQPERSLSYQPVFQVVFAPRDNNDIPLTRAHLYQG